MQAIQAAPDAEAREAQYDKLGGMLATLKGGREGGGGGGGGGEGGGGNPSTDTNRPTGTTHALVLVLHIITAAVATGLVTAKSATKLLRLGLDAYNRTIERRGMARDDPLARGAARALVLAQLSRHCATTTAGPSDGLPATWVLPLELVVEVSERCGLGADGEVRGALERVITGMLARGTDGERECGQHAANRTPASTLQRLLNGPLAWLAPRIPADRVSERVLSERRNAGGRRGKGCARGAKA